jgi:predicted secreted protein
MGWVTGIAVYLVLWWIVLFAVLPWGVQPVGDEAPPGAERGAPARPRLALKMAVTTVVAALLWGVVELVVLSDLVTFRQPL